MQKPLHQAHAPRINTWRVAGRLYRLGTSLCALVCLALCLAERPALAQQSSFNDPRVQEALKALDQEPSIQEVHKAALRFYHAEPETIDSLRTRAAYKSLLPDVNVSYRQGNNGVFINKFDYLQGDPNMDSQVGQDLSRGDVYEWQVSGSWSLSRLMFNPEVLDVASLAALQEGVLKEVTRLYYTRRRLQIDFIISNPTDPGTRLSKQIRIDQLTATLDALTNNLFAQHAAETQRISRGGGGW